MAKSIVINRPNGKVTLVRCALETTAEDPLTEHEQIINELFKLSLPIPDKEVQLELFGRGVYEHQNENGDDMWDDGKLYWARKMFIEGVEWARNYKK